MPDKRKNIQDVSVVVDTALRSINQLEGRIEIARDQYASLKEKCESAVKEWRWATAEMNHLRLLLNERGQYPVGRWLKKRPANSEDRCEYGLDSDERPLVIRQGIWGAENVVHQTFFIYDNDWAEAIRFDSMFENTKRDDSVSVIRQSLLDGIPVECTWFASHQRGFESYQYNSSGRLVGIDATWTNQPHKDKNILSAQFEASYDDSGTLELVTVNYRSIGIHKGGFFTCYKRKKSKKET